MGTRSLHLGAAADDEPKAARFSLITRCRPQRTGGKGKTGVGSTNTCRTVSRGNAAAGANGYQGASPSVVTPASVPALVECAWRMVRFQPQYPPVQKRPAVLAKGSGALGAVRKKAIVAVARRLAVDLWRIHTGRCTAEQLGLTI